MRDAKALLASVNIVDVIDRYVPLEKCGSEFFGKCPFHDDHKSSLQVNESKQIFKCFACGPGGDAISFLMELGNTFNEACDILEGESTGQFEPKQRQAMKSDRPKWEQIKPETPLIQIHHYRHGKPSDSWCYTDKYGYAIGYVCRFDLGDGEKETIPMVYATDGNRSEWRWMGFKTPRPLYGLHLIEKHPDATVIIVEGEKCAQFGQNYFEPERYIFTTWPGGSNAVAHVDWSPLENRTVIKWPDNDIAGFKAMNSIPIDGNFIHVPSFLPKKWDVADREWQASELMDFIIDNSKPEPLPVDEDEVIEDDLPEQTKTEPTKRGSGPLDNENFRILGYERLDDGKIRYHFYSYHSKMVISLTPSQMSKPNLMTLAPLSWLEMMFPGQKSNISIDAAIQFMIAHGHRAGVFSNKRLRGRGAWFDGEDFVVHDGTHLKINGLKMELTEYRSQFIYEVSESFQIGMNNPMNYAESRLLLEKFKWLGWERGDVAARLAAGWCVIAPICGVLNWRPHVWITGAAGSGKSWIMDNMIRALIGNVSVIVQGQSTAPGVRAQIGNDARPVLFDEADVTDQRDKDRVQGVVSLARLSSYKDGGVIVKGTASGGSISYRTNSIFAFASIGVQLIDQSDRSRFTVLSLRTDESKKSEFKQFAADYHRLVTESYARRLQARTLKNVKTLITNIETFGDAFTFVLGNKRTADQLSALMAGSLLLETDALISFDEAVKMIQSYKWEDEIGLDQTRDEMQLFERLMTHQLRVEGVDGRTVERTIGELINVAAGLVSELIKGVYKREADQLLRRHGFIVNTKTSRVYISTSNASSVFRILKDTNWANNFGRILERLPEARPETSRTFTNGLKSRCVSVPLGSLVDDGIGGFDSDNNFSEDLF